LVEILVMTSITMLTPNQNMFNFASSQKSKPIKVRIISMELKRFPEWMFD